MSNRRHVVVASARIGATPKRLYDIIADYRSGHPRILPGRFSDLRVERGGVGAGTIIRFQVRLFGRAQTFRAAVSEPDPGRVLVETNLEGRHAITTFTIRGTAEGDGAEVTIATELTVRSGVAGSLERFLTTRALRSLYKEELTRLASCVAASAGPLSPF